MPSPLHRLLENLLSAFDPAAVPPHYKPSVLGFMVPPPHKESWSLRLAEDGAALLPGLAHAEIVIQAPLEVFERGLTPGQPWDVWASTHIVGFGSPGDGALLSRVRRYPLRQGSNGIEITVVGETSRATGSRWGAVRGYWVAEAGTITASRPKLAQVELKLKKLAALGYDTGELEDDAPAYARLMTDAFEEELRFLAEDAIFNGDGAGKPLGILNAPALVHPR